MANLLRNIPSVNELLENPALKDLSDKVSHNVVVTEVRSFLDRLRSDVQEKAQDFQLPAAGELAEKIAQWIQGEERAMLKPVLNATGILLHTGLGRAPLCEEALRDMLAISSGYATVEVDPESGQRSQRTQAVERLLRQLTGAEAVAVVNNNAGATMLALAALAHGKEVVVSRGELIEIGGSFRLPDVMTTSGCQLKEVGTTNKTHLRDYEDAIGEDTAALMHAHTSNFKVVGFTHKPAIEELVALGNKHKIPVIDDIGSGAMVDFSKYGLDGEPVVAQRVAAGADVVLFSGDKLLGGPQCGIIVGRKKWIDKISKHPMMRALRVDKITLAALAATLQLYRDEQEAERSIPLLAMLSSSPENLQNRAERMVPQIVATDAVESAEVVADVTYLGGGTIPTQEIPTRCVSIVPKDRSVDELAKQLRQQTPAVFSRVQQDRLLLDLRSVMPSDDHRLIDAVTAVSSD